VTSSLMRLTTRLTESTLHTQISNDRNEEEELTICLRLPELTAQSLEAGLGTPTCYEG
jgi:hypothetical protein